MTIRTTVFLRGDAETRPDIDSIKRGLEHALAGLFTTTAASTGETAAEVGHRRLADYVHEFTLPIAEDSLAGLRLHPSISALEKALNADINFQLPVSTPNPGLVVFDMDSTLIEQEVIDELGRFLGVSDVIADITRRAMEGELDFSASLKARVSLLKGLDGGVWETMKRERITFAKGAREVTKALKKAGSKLAVLSGGFLPLANWVKAELGLDYAFANQLVVGEDGLLTGGLEGEIVHAEKKRELLKWIAEKEGVDIGRTVAVGDGANDLLMMGVAGTGIAVDAKPKVQIEAPTKVNPRGGKGLLEILFVLGYTEEQVEELLKD